MTTPILQVKGRDTEGIYNRQSNINEKDIQAKDACWKLPKK